MALCPWEEPYPSLLGCSWCVQEKQVWKVGLGRDHEAFLATGKDLALVPQVMGVFSDEDVKQILKMIEPEVFTEEEEVEEEGEEEEEDEEEKEEDEEEEAHEKEDEEKEEAEEAAEEEKEELEEGLLQMKLPESVKLQVGFSACWLPSIWAPRYPVCWSLSPGLCLAAMGSCGDAESSGVVL